MATIVELDGVAPTIGEDVFLAPTAVLIGDVRVGDRCNIWFGTVLRGDARNSHIEIGAGCSIQDNTVVHCADDLPTVIGADVVVGHGAMLEGCTVDDRALIGMGSIILQHVHVGAGAMIAAGTVVPERQRDPRRRPRRGRPRAHPEEGAIRFSARVDRVRRRPLPGAPRAIFENCSSQRGEPACPRC